MAFEVFDDVAFYWFLLAVLVMFIVPITKSFLSVALVSQEANWTRGMTSCKEKVAAVDGKAAKLRRSQVFGWRGIGFVVGWVSLVYLGLSFATMQVGPAMQPAAPRCCGTMPGFPRSPPAPSAHEPSMRLCGSVSAPRRAPFRPQPNPLAALALSPFPSPADGRRLIASPRLLPSYRLRARRCTRSTRTRF